MKKSTVQMLTGRLIVLSMATVFFAASALGQANIAPTGTGAIWQNLPSATDNSSKTAHTGINDGNVTTEIVLTDVATAWYLQAAGVVWASPQNSIVSVKFHNGDAVDLTTNGWFVAGMRVQSSADGTTWSDVAGWSVLPAYPYSASASNQVYTLSGSAISNVRGVRVIGQLYTVYASSWAVHVKEVEVIGVQGSPDTQAPTAPTGLTTSNITSFGVTVSWTASTDNVGVTSYEVFRGGTTSCGTTATTTLDVTGLSVSTAYSITVKAKDASGNVSAASSPVSVSTISGGMGIPIIINKNVKHQTIDGFGFFGPMHTWWDSNDPNYFYSNAWLDLVLSDLGITIWRNEYYPPALKAGDPAAVSVNQSNWNQDATWDKEKPVVMAMKAKADALGVPLKFIFTVWSPPADLKCALTNMQPDPSKYNDGGCKWGGTLNPNKYAQFATWLKAGIQQYKDAGIDLYAISPQNEPYFFQPYNSCFYQPDWYTAMIKAVMPSVKQAYPTVKIIGAEHMLENEGTAGGSEYGYQMNLLRDTVANRYMDIVSVHGYSDGVAASSGSKLATYWNTVKTIYSKPFNKKSWMTETSGYANSWESIDKPGALALASDILNGLIHGDMAGWVYWYGSAGDLMDGMTLHKPYFACKQFYRYIRPGAVRVDASSADTAIAVGAFENTAMGTNTIILINTASTIKNISLSGVTGNFQMFASTATDGCVSKGVFPSTSAIAVPARSTVTLITSGGAILKSNFESRQSSAAMSRSGLSVYPDNAQGRLILDFGSTVSKADISILDIQGRVRLLRSINNVQTDKVDIRSLSNGVYIAHVAIGERTVQARFVKK